MSESISWRTLLPGQRARIRIWDHASGAVRTVHESDQRLYEAPNWTDDGRLLVNGDGRLWFLPADGSVPPEPFDAPGLPPVNNDHVLAPDGTGVFASASDHHIWHVPFDGGPIHRVTQEDGPLHFLHGVSPDGSQLAYVRLEPQGGDLPASARIHLIGADGRGDRAVTTDPGPADGSAFTPDGQWILFNTEQFSTTPGHAQLARIRPDGTGLEQLTADERVNWFPHVAPTGDVTCYVSFPPGTVGHPENRSVQLRLVTMGAWREPTTLVSLHGGQGTMNVPSWAPDGSAFAFVDYPVPGEDAATTG
ncbi:PD40 domain-containing protein [Brachybacterium fresconis]|uniref:Dipeptidyl aminopeptidase/acylaminoacyl peptidase n=1 Tax=Brachybacterium fresconis TaxID=173363 RepID=A0ABS4YLH1_9MICO|nr:PD40 domain-containing protein [Brachybacterium fresconis]MBP2409645.1 dipeptidyl aminopeptidase/acylaminoacyl peptidase [Brachybacterium fresconis]